MEIDVTAFIDAHADHMDRFSDSIANSGLEDIGQRTWKAALAEAARQLVCTDASELVDHFADYGAWEREELEAMPAEELNALLIQFIAGDYQEYTDADERGKLSDYLEGGGGGRLYQGDHGEWYYYIGC